MLPALTPDDFGNVTPVSWSPPTGMDFSQWERIGRVLFFMQSAINFWIADWLNEGERRYGETYAQAIEVTGWTEQRLRNAKWVGANVPQEIRRPELSWTAHTYVASATFTPEEKRAWLDTAAERGWDSRTLRQQMKVHKSTPPEPDHYNELPQIVLECIRAIEERGYHITVSGPDGIPVYHS